MGAKQIPMVQEFGITGIPLINQGDDLGAIISDRAEKQGTPFQDKDILVIEQKIVSKAEGRVMSLSAIKPSEFAVHIAKQTGKEPELVELILREAQSVVRMREANIITRTNHGFICANSGVDKSNVSGGKDVTLLPIDPDASARRIRETIVEKTGKNVFVIVSDTFGRPFREGVANVCIGLSGIRPIVDLRGQHDLFGYQLRIKQIAIVDELASAAELVAGNADEGIPAVIVRGFNRYEESEAGRARELVRPAERDIFL